MSRSQTTLIELLGCGKPPINPVREPEADAYGNLVLESGESTLYEGSHRVALNIWAKSGGRRGGEYRWRQLIKPERKAAVRFTDQRLLLAWPNWKSDRTSGSLFERRLMSVVVEREQGKMVLGTHIRHPWVVAVYVGKTTGALSPRRKLRVDFHQGENPSAFEIFGLDPAVGEEVGRSFSAAVAGQRRESHPDLTDEQVLSLERLAAADAVTDDVGWADRYAIPAGTKVGHLFQ